MAKVESKKEEVVDKTASDPSDEINKTTAQLARERRHAEEDAKAKGEVVDEGRSFAVEGNDLSGYFGVSPEYMTYANDTDRPFKAEEGSAERRDEDELEARRGDHPLGLFPVSTVGVEAVPVTDQVEPDVKKNEGGTVPTEQF